MANIPPIYFDRLVEVYSDGMKLKYYYLPFGNAKIVFFSQIRTLEKKSPTLLNGRWRLGGTGDFQTWFTTDWRRPQRDALFYLTLNSQNVKIVFTVEDTEAFIAALKGRVQVLSA
jgi:hypothetical protein